MNPGDQINGGGGTDTLKIYAGGNAANFGAATIRNVEIVEVYEDANLNVSANADVQQVWSYGGINKTMTARVDQVIGFGNQAGATTETAVFTDVAGSADAATIALKDAGKTTAFTTSLTVAGIEALTVDAAGKNQIGALTVAQAETITFKGTGTVKASIAGATALKSIDASGNSGGVDLTMSKAVFGTNENKVTGGTGNDKITFSDALDQKATIDLGSGKNTLGITQGATALTAGSTFKGGSGSEDTLNLITTTVINATNGKMFTGFENIMLSGTTSSYKVGDIAGISGYEIATTTSGTLTNLADATNVKVSGTGGVAVLTLADNSAATSSVKIAIDNGQVGKAPAAGLDNDVTTNARVLNIESGGNVTAASTNKATLVGAASLDHVTNVKITGDQKFEFVTGAAETLTLIDGSAATGKLEITATGSKVSMQIRGGENDDTITATNVAGAVTTVVSSKGSDTITFGATAANNAGDTYRLTSQEHSNAAGFDKIVNFEAGAANSDILDLTAFGFEGAQADIFTKAPGSVTWAGTGVNATFSITDAAANNFFDSAGDDMGVALRTDGTDTFA